MNLLSELKRRNVFKVGVAYLALGWVVIQVTDVAVPALNLPESLNSIVVYLGLIGFPFAIFFAWAFELTPEGVKKTEDVDTDASISHETGRKLEYFIIAALVVAVVFLLFDRSNIPMSKAESATNEETLSADAAPAESAMPSIAVLPFADMSAKGDQEYFGDGIAEELLNVLVRIENINVTSRTSSFAFKDKRDMSLSAIGNELKVDHVLEGSIRTSGNMVRVTAQLIDVKTDKHLWSETYDRPLDNIFAIQDEISHAIVEALKAKLGTEDKTLVKAGTKNMEAYATYLKGLAALGKRDLERNEAVVKAIALLREATKLDPTYADAWASLGKAEALGDNYFVYETAREAAEKGRAATNMALMLDPDNPIALMTSAVIKYQYEGDFEGAEPLFQRALIIAPNDSEIYNFYGDYLSAVMDIDKAVVVEKRAMDMDPYSRINRFEYAQTLISAGKVEEGLQGLNDLIVQYPDWLFLRGQLFFIYRGMERYDDAYQALEISRRQNPNDKYLNFQHDVINALKGDEKLKQKVLSVLPDGANWEKAMLHYDFGNYDDSATELRKIDVSLINYYMIRFAPMLDPRIKIEGDPFKEVRNLPQFKALMDIRRKNLGLNEEAS